MSRYGQPLGNQFLKATPAQLIVMLGYLDTREYSDRDIQVFMDWVLETRSLVPARFMVDAMGRSGVVLENMKATGRSNAGYKKP